MYKIILLYLCLLSPFYLCAAEPPAVGEILNKNNVKQFSEYLDQPTVQLLQQELFTIEVGETFDINQPEEFITQTENNKGKASIDPVTGQLVNYLDGLPFPDTLDRTDPQAGLKLAWNMRYTYGGDNSLVDPFIWEYRNMKSGKVERTLSFVGKTLRFKHRVKVSPIPELPKNPAGIYNAIYLLANKPFDLRNTQLLVHRLEDDTERDQTWMYLSAQRRVRRLPTGQTTDAFLGSDIMIEDFLGYNGRIKDMTWKFLGTKQLLMPFFRYDLIKKESEATGSDDFHFGQFHGQGNCFPNVPWQLRKSYILEAVPKWQQHPLSKRIYYVDAQTYAPVAGRYYDRSKKIWRIAIGGFSHPDYHLDHNKGSGVPIPSLITMIDIQAMHCTTLKMKTLINVDSENQNDFTVQALRSKGR